MTEKTNTQAADSSNGLPELESRSNKNIQKSKKKPPLGFVIALLVILGTAGFGIQYAINYFGVFDTSKATVEEPPVPQVQTNIDEEINNGFVINESSIEEQTALPLSSEQKEPSESLESIESEDLKSINDSLLLITQQLKAVSGELAHYKSLLVQTEARQLELAKKLDFNFSHQTTANNEIKTGIRENQRWLGGVSNQLKEIGVDVKEATQEFPIIVYNKSVWGDDVFLTIAQKVNPEQTSFLRVGGIVGRWRLVEISAKKALFEHFDGNKKEVML